MATLTKTRTTDEAIYTLTFTEVEARNIAAQYDEDDPAPHMSKTYRIVRDREYGGWYVPEPDGDSDSVYESGSWADCIACVKGHLQCLSQCARMRAGA